MARAVLTDGSPETDNYVRQLCYCTCGVDQGSPDADNYVRLLRHLLLLR